MKKKIISLISITVASALTITAALNLFPPLYEKYVKSPSLSDEDFIDPVPVNEENFPDENFRSYILNLEASLEGEHTVDGVFDREELLQVTSIIVNSLEIENLSGIEYFTSLEVLDCSDNNLDSLDTGKLVNLAKLDCSFNKLSELNVKDNLLLTELCCSNNPLKALDLSGNYNLWRFECSNTQLTSLNTDIINPNEPDKQIEFDYFEVNNSSYIASNCNNEAFDFDLTSLCGSFDVEKASNWNGAKPEGTVLKNITNGTVVAYTYDVGRGLSVDFSITFQEGHNLVKVEDRAEICCADAELWQCTECGKFFADEKAQNEAEVSTEHKYNEGVVEKQPACTEEGILLKTCQVCGYEHSETIDMLPHNADEKYEFDENQHWKICKDCGQEFNREDHTIDGESDICLVCGETISKHIHKLEHIEEKASSCTEEGLKEHYYCAGCEKYYSDSEAENEISYEELVIEKLAHQYEFKFDEIQHWEECVFCGEKMNTDEHSLEKDTVEPTCCKDGMVINICTVCGFTELIETIPATKEHIFDTEYTYDDNHHWFNCSAEGCEEKNQAAEHSFAKIEITKNPTCAEEGIMTYICEICGYNKTEVIPKSENHSYSDNCVQVDENTHSKVCTVCGEISDIFEHEFNDTEIIKEASCDDGILRSTCICGYYKDEVIPAVDNHDFTGGYSDLGETHSAVCKVCGSSSEPQEHYYDIKIIKATCCDSGKMVYTCILCGHSYTEETGEPTGQHSFSDEFTLEGDNHIHKCTTEGCIAEDIHNKNECKYNPPENTAPVYDVDDNRNDNSELSEKPVIEIVWPTTMGVVLNPYNMKIELSEDSKNNSVNVTDSSNGSDDTVLSNELSFINNGNTEIKVTVTGSVSALSNVDNKGHTKVSDKIVFATDTLEQPGWDSTGTVYNRGEARNAVLLFLEVASDMDANGKRGIYSEVFDKNNKNQMLLGTEKTSRELFNIAPKDDNGAGVTNLRLFGELALDPETSWYEVLKTDFVNISLVFDVSFDDPSESSNTSENTEATTEEAAETKEPVKTEESAGTEEPPKKEEDFDADKSSNDAKNKDNDTSSNNNSVSNAIMSNGELPAETELPDKTDVTVESENINNDPS